MEDKTYVSSFNTTKLDVNELIKYTHKIILNDCFNTTKLDVNKKEINELKKIKIKFQYYEVRRKRKVRI